MLQIEYNVEQVASDEVVMEGERVKDDHVPTEANKEFQQLSKKVDTDKSSEERDLDYDDQFDDLPDTENVIFVRRGKKIIVEENDEDNDNDSDYMLDDIDSDSKDNEYKVALTVNKSDTHRTTTSKSACDTQGTTTNAEIQGAIAANAEDQGAAVANAEDQGEQLVKKNKMEWRIGLILEIILVGDLEIRSGRLVGRNVM